MPGPLRHLLIAVGVTVLVVGAGTALTSPDRSSGAAPADATVVRLEDLDTRSLTARRADFCTAVAPQAVAAALAVPVPDDDAPPVVPTGYGNGQQAALTDSLTDVAHEYGCTWESPDGVRARAWVFAPPVTRAEATAMARAQRADDDCTPLPGAARFGRSSVAQLCQGRDAVIGAYRALFGDAWLTCTLSLPTTGRTPAPAEQAERLDAWCAAVLMAVSGPR